MNENVFARKWRPMHGELKSSWSELTDIMRRYTVQCLLMGVGLGYLLRPELRLGAWWHRDRCEKIADAASGATKLEVYYELRKGLTAAITLGIGLGIVVGGGMLLMLMLVQGLAVFMVVPLWAGYGIAGSALVVLGGVVLAAGRTKAEEPDLVPQRAVERINQNAQWLTKQATSDKRCKKPVKISRTPVRR
jgi:hypothetical protein